MLGYYSANQQFSNAGLPLNGGYLYIYLPGTSTPQTTYTDSTGSTPNANPIQLNAYGRLANEIWVAQGNSAKVVLTDLALNVLDTKDWVPSISSVSQSSILSLFSDAGNASNGAGLSGFGQSLNYAIATIGGAVQSGMPSLWWAFTDAEIADVKSGAHTIDLTAKIQACLDAHPCWFVPAGSYKTTSALLFNDNNFLHGAGRATQFYPTQNGSFIAGKSVTPAAGTNIRRYNGGGQNFMVYGPGTGSANSIALDMRGCTMFKWFNLLLQNIATGVRHGNGYNSYYNEYHAVDISTVVSGYLNDTLGNENKVFGGRVSSPTTGTQDGDCSHNVYFGLAIEVFTTAHKTVAPQCQYIEYYSSRCENTPTSGTAYLIDATSAGTMIFGGEASGVSTIINDASGQAMVFRDANLTVRGGTPALGHYKESIVKDIASLGAGATRQETFTLTHYSPNDTISIKLPLSWPAGLIMGPCIDGGTNTIYVQLYNPTGAPIDPPSATFLFEIWKY